ncbi:unnamed protein product [Porites evermanni]|uniref:Uncharacterized protein n=1 Tax=Porites evermanni TaxID=104178 RepID=A0ABN8MKB1_9CNID|nr:unnamed protein product [Porites evermanni]
MLKPAYEFYADNRPMTKKYQSIYLNWTVEDGKCDWAMVDKALKEQSRTTSSSRIRPYFFGGTPDWTLKPVYQTTPDQIRPQIRQQQTIVRPDHHKSDHQNRPPPPRQTTKSDHLARPQTTILD